MATATVVQTAHPIELEEGISSREESTSQQVEVSSERNAGQLQQPLDFATKAKLVCAGYSFFCAGVNDGSLGPIIPYLLKSYNIGTNFVSIVYGVTFLGWFFAALTNPHLTQVLDLGALLVLGASLQLLAHILRVWLPPFGLFAASFFFAHSGQGYQDTHANTYVSSVKAAHRWLGFIHAMYMLGCLIGPFVSTAVSAANTPSNWNLFYSFPLGLCAINVGVTAWAFRDTLRLKPTGNETSQDTEARSSVNKSALRSVQETIKIPAVWILSLYFFFFLGVAITASGWVVTYLVEVRNGDVSKVGYVNAGFAGGAFIGRVFLAEPIHRLGERISIFVCVVLCLGLQLVFWLVPNLIAGAVAISLLGFFSGPFFATGIHVGSKLFPEHVKSSALSIVFVIGQVGGSIFPAITGVIAAHAGVKVLQPVLVGLIAATGITWLCLPRSRLHRE